jgi:hypothetical protein
MTIDERLEALTHSVELPKCKKRPRRSYAELTSNCDA